jgi:mannose-1-phosphate guanylyltransferase
MSGASLPVLSLADQAEDPGGEPRTWAVVLAGGKGERLSRLTRHIYGEDRPKQYAALTGGKSLLRQTLERVGGLVPSDRTVVVTMAGQGAYMTAELCHESLALHVLDQPKDRGTAAAVLLAAHWIQARDSRARVVVLPSDHFVADDRTFMVHVAEIFDVLRHQPERIVLLGATPSEPETDYGWIELGEGLSESTRTPMYRVLHFREKPTQALANELLRSGALWNTFIFAGRAAALVEMGRECLPLLHERLARLQTFVGTEHEPWALRQAYEFAPRASFSRAILERCPRRLAVMRLVGVGWRDLGTPRRVIQTLEELGIRPDWLAAFQVTV